MEYVEAGAARIPALGFGTFELESGDAYRMVRHVLDCGYRHVDTAQMYRNEEAVGRALRDARTRRDDVFITTKVWMDHFRDGDLQRSVEASLERLAVDAADLVLLHWPNPDVPLAETLRALLDARQRGLTRHVGISNFPSRLMREAVDIAGPGELVTNQVEYHPFLSQRHVLDTARALGMSVTAYSPLARGEVVGHPLLARIGEPYGKNAAQVALRWLLDQQVIALPRTRTEAHAESNLDVFDFHLTTEDHAAIERELLGNYRLIEPSFAPEWDPA